MGIYIGAFKIRGIRVCIGIKPPRTDFALFDKIFKICYNKTKIYKMPLSGGDIHEISISENYLDIRDFEIVNGYIYLTEYDRNSKNYIYYRLKTDGTGLTKQKKPFEWKY